MKRCEGRALPVVSLWMCWPNMLAPGSPQCKRRPQHSCGPPAPTAVVPGCSDSWASADCLLPPRPTLKACLPDLTLCFTVFSPSKTVFLLPFLLYSQPFFLLFLYCLLLFLLHPWLCSLPVFSLYTCRYSLFTLILCFSSVFCHTRKETHHIKVCVFLSFHITKPALHRGLWAPGQYK